MVLRVKLALATEFCSFEKSWTWLTLAKTCRYVSESYLIHYYEIMAIPLFEYFVDKTLKC